MCIENDEINSGIEQAESDPVFLNELMENINHDQHKMKDRELASKIILELSIIKPDLLYPKWSIFIDYLKGKNAFSKLVSLIVIANMVKYDSMNLIDQDLDKYLRLLHDESVMIVSHCALNCSKIVEARIDLEQIITTELLELDAPYYHHTHKELVKANAIETFITYYENSNLKAEILGFVNNQVNSSSGKTKKSARKFLTKYQ